MVHETTEFPSTKFRSGQTLDEKTSRLIWRCIVLSGVKWFRFVNCFAVVDNGRHDVVGTKLHHNPRTRVEFCDKWTRAQAMHREIRFIPQRPRDDVLYTLHFIYTQCSLESALALQPLYYSFVIELYTCSQRPAQYDNNEMNYDIKY